MDDLNRLIFESAETKDKQKQANQKGAEDKQGKLLEVNNAIFQCMENSISLTSIHESLKEQGFNVGRTTLSKFMKDRYPELYESNYSSRAPKRKSPGSDKSVTKKSNGSTTNSDEIIAGKTDKKSNSSSFDRIDEVVSDLSNSKKRNRS